MTRLLAISASLLLLSACAQQQTTPNFETAAGQQCASDCLANHAGLTRACNDEVLGTRSGQSDAGPCLESADETLQACYETCE